MANKALNNVCSLLGAGNKSDAEYLVVRVYIHEVTCLGNNQFSSPDPCNVAFV